MFIKKIISYGKTQDEIQSQFSDEISDIRASLFELTPDRIRATRPDIGPKAKDDEITSWKTQTCWEEAIKEQSWYQSNQRIETGGRKRFYFRLLGHISGDVSVKLIRHQDLLNRWLYTVTPIAYKNTIIKLPIAILLLKNTEQELHDRALPMRANFERVMDELKELEPLSITHPFVLIGASLEDGDIEWLKIDSEKGISENKIIINRSIEFPPEYRQAGLGILNYFGEVIRERYPEESTKVKIEQEGLSVRLIVETEDGSRDVIEKALKEYELVVRGEQPPEFLFESKTKIMELKNELRIAEMRIESQRDLIEYQRDDVRELKQLFGNALTTRESAPINLTVSPCINVSTTQTSNINVCNDLTDIVDSLQYLIDSNPNDPFITMRLNDLLESTENVGDMTEQDKVKSSSAINKMKRFLDEANEAGSKLNSFFNTMEDGANNLKSIARKYNSIAEWCGAPQVPSAFL